MAIQIPKAGSDLHTEKPQFPQRKTAVQGSLGYISSSSLVLENINQV